MKKLFIAALILCTLGVNIALAKSFIDEVSDIVGERPDVNINLGTGIIKTILAFSGDDDAKEARKIMQGLDKIRISVFELDEMKNTHKLANLIKTKVNHLSSLGYEQLVTIRDDEELVYIVAKVQDSNLKDAMIIAMDAEDELVIISLDGEVDLQQLAEISDHFDVDIEDVLDI